MDEFLSNHRFNDKISIRLILLDEVTDPQNVGAIIRSALAFKMDGLALSQRNSPQETSALTKASSESHTPSLSASLSTITPLPSVSPEHVAQASKSVE